MENVGFRMIDSENVFMTRSAFIKKFKEKHHEELSGYDVADAGINRTVTDVKPNKASILDVLFAVAGVGTFIADIVTDTLVAKQHYGNNDIAWFTLTCIFIVLPSLIMQVFSCKWFHDDYLNQTWWTYFLHLFQLGTIERYILALWYGLKTMYIKPVEKSDYTRYLNEWRDIAFLRLPEGFLEAAPQMILQLYILTVQQEFITERDWLTATSAVLSTISLSWAIVSYSQAVRICLDNKVLSIFGYCFQISYYLLMVASRVVVLVLFASAFRSYIFIFIFCHCALMFVWLFWMDIVVSTDQGREERILEKIYTFIVSIIYLFCFFNVHTTKAKHKISVYYSIMIVENAVLMAAWFPYRTLHGALLYAAFGLVFGGFFIGIIFMLLYYKYFDPSRFPFSSRKSANTGYPIVEDSSVSIEENREYVIVNKKHEMVEKQRPSTPGSPHDDMHSIPVETIQPNSPSKAERTRSSPEHTKIVVNSDNAKEYGSTHSLNSTSKRGDHRCTLSSEALHTMQKRENLNRETEDDAFIMESNGWNHVQKNEATNGRWIVMISKQKDFNRFYNETGILENKTELGNLHLNQERFDGQRGRLKTSEKKTGQTENECI